MLRSGQSPACAQAAAQRLWIAHARIFILRETIIFAIAVAHYEHRKVLLAEMPWLSDLKPPDDIALDTGACLQQPAGACDSGSPDGLLYSLKNEPGSCDPLHEMTASRHAKTTDALCISTFAWQLVCQRVLCMATAAQHNMF